MQESYDGYCFMIQILFNEQLEISIKSDLTKEDREDLHLSQDYLGKVL